MRTSANTRTSKSPRLSERWRPCAWLAGLALSLVLPGGCTDQRCYQDVDCPSSKLCGAAGKCVFECDLDRPCAEGFECVSHRCKAVPVEPIVCPVDMVAVAGAFCVDRYEASRPDATSSSAGRDGSRAMSVAGVVPWQVADNATAGLACAAVGKRLCAADEWRSACKGADGTVYAYGDVYDPAVCNGIDTFGRQDFHLAPTGSFPGCTNEWGVLDINGNLWEHVADGSNKTVRGGAFNCNDSAALHKCDYVPGNWSPSALGFRCCLTPADSGTRLDGGVPDTHQALDTIEAGSDAGEGGAGCVDDGDAGPLDGAVFEVERDVGREDRAADVSGAGEVDAPVTLDGASHDGAFDLGADREADAAGRLDGGGASCPPEMALVGATCVDRYEASRQDATATSAGTSEGMALSRPGVLPWYVNPMSEAALATFQSACQASGKRLCGATEWLESCRGPGQSTYFFGNDWDASTCNSVDTYCQKCCDILGLASCPTGENCGYAGALTSSYSPETCSISAAYGKDTCHVCFHVMPTGAFPKCTNASGLFDVNGNVWEVVPVPTSEDSRGYQVRGGAFNCGSPSARFQCTFNAGWTELYAGFRCCKDSGGP